jgi:malonyl-CoA decarboxylase
MRHEAVHAISDWADLRRRLEADRRCFAFFHPQLPGEPLIFVEVALLRAIPATMTQLIGAQSGPLAQRRPTVAAFYSISNCEPGLRGVSLGNFLIKRVADHLKSELRSLRRFCTLSPIPSFAGWLRQPGAIESLAATDTTTHKRLLAGLRTLHGRYGADLETLGAAVAGGTLQPEDREILEHCAAVYLCWGTLPDRGDPVARFHLHNGARLERINADADLSPKGVRESFGLMVNYLYELDAVESNNDRFVHGHVVRSRHIAGLAPERPRI